MYIDVSIVCALITDSVESVLHTSLKFKTLEKKDET